MNYSLWEKRRLGYTGFYVTPIGLGGASLGRSLKDVNFEMGVSTVLRALELGINVIDTSCSYLEGKSEMIIGKALQEWHHKGGHREDIILSSKTGTRTSFRDYSADGTKESIEKSLQALRTDYIDVIFIHDPEDLTPVLTHGGALDALKEFKAQRVIKAIGLGVREHAFHQRCIETGEFDVSLTYRDYNLLDQSATEGVLDIALAYGVGVYNGMPIIKGLLEGRDPLIVARELQEARNALSVPYHMHGDEVQRAHQLWEFCQEHQTSLLALNLQFCMHEPRIASTLLGASTPEEVEADIAAVSEPIPEKIWEKLYTEFGL